jgi:alpha-L-rhamnosidase
MKTPKLIRQVVSAAICILAIFLTVRCDTSNQPQTEYFKKARPIWPVGRQLEKNLTVVFNAQFDKPVSGPAELKIAGSTLYRIYLNGEFIGHGPARAGHGYYRVDGWNLSKSLVTGKNILRVEVAGYNVNSYYLLDQPSFIQAEVVSGDKVLVATSVKSNDFEAFESKDRIQKVPRYSFQRPFTEVYFLTRVKGEGLRLKVEDVGTKKLVPRRIAYPDFKVRGPVKSIARGEMITGIDRGKYWKDRAVVDIGKKLGGYPENELVINPAIPLQEMENKSCDTVSSEFMPGQPLALGSKQFRIFDFGTNLTGFVGATIDITRAGRVYFTFDEILTDGGVNFKRLGCINAVTYDMSPGKYVLESFEPYTMRYLKIVMVDGDCSISNITLREYVNPDIARASFESSDLRLNRIFTAGVETFRQNAVDIFMDCPHRERAGWLCDSYFTARVANDVSGNTLIEKNFFENFALPNSFKFLPKGMLPMCYPADHNDGVFIPNWAMWFVIHLKEYQSRSNDRELVEQLKPKVLKLLKYFEPFKNSDGLLEKLKSWIFVEWSAANDFVQDVNYPTNMLFAATLDAAGDLYGIESLKQEAAAIRETIRKQSYNGTFFVDNAVRNDKGKLEITKNTSEVCQYYAFYFKVANRETHPELWKKLAEQFGPGRKDNNPYPEVHFANSFVGNYLRLELLSQNNLQSQLLEESIGFFDYMAIKTGTLWENISAYASCNHGFASHVVHVLYRDVLGIADIDINKKQVTLQFSDLNLASCKGEMPVGNEMVRLEWVREGNNVTYHYDGPEGFTVLISSSPALNLTKK